MRAAPVIALAAAVYTTTAAGSPATPFTRLESQSFGAILATRGHKALYAWNVEKADEQPDQVLCNNVDGWFVVRL